MKFLKGKTYGSSLCRSTYLLPSDGIDDAEYDCKGCRKHERYQDGVPHPELSSELTVQSTHIPEGQGKSDAEQKQGKMGRKGNRPGDGVIGTPKGFCSHYIKS